MGRHIISRSLERTLCKLAAGGWSSANDPSRAACSLFCQCISHDRTASGGDGMGGLGAQHRGNQGLAGWCAVFVPERAQPEGGVCG